MMNTKHLGEALKRYNVGGHNPSLKKLDENETKALFLVLQIRDFTLDELHLMERYAHSIVRTR